MRLTSALGTFGDTRARCLNDGKGRFTDAPAGSLPAKKLAATCLEFVDLDGDRDRDLYIGTNGQDRVLKNDGRGKFSEGPALPVLSDRTAGVLAGDIDGDHDVDLLVRNFHTTGPLPGKLTAAATARASYSVPVPKAPSLLGKSFFAQALVEVQTQSGRSLRLTNVERQTFVGF